MRITEDGGFRTLHLEPEGPSVSTSADAVDLVGSTWGQNVSVIAIPVTRLDPAFFDLSSLIAGEITQKIVNYRLRLAVIGDISGFLAASSSLRDYVWESNRGDHVWFFEDEAGLHEKLGARQTPRA